MTAAGTEAGAPGRDGTWEPHPAARWEDAFLGGNGRHGAMVYGDPADDRVVVNHHTLVRPNGSEHAGPPLLADRLEHLQDALLAGDTTAAEQFGAEHPLLWVQPFHPAFQTRVRRLPSTVDRRAGTAGYRRSVDFATGEICASHKDWRSRVFVSRADDVIVQCITGFGLAVELTLDHALPGAPPRLAVGRSTALTADGARLALRAGYPSSDLAYTGVTVARVDRGSVTVSGEGIRIDGARTLLLLTRVRRHTGDLDLAEEWEALPYADYETLLARHRPLHRTAYERATLTLHAEAKERALPGNELIRRPESPALLERLFAAGRYHLLSAAGVLPPRLTGLWTGDWDTAWSGAFTTNANLNLQIASAAAAALPEVSEAHAGLVRGQLADWRDNARAIFGARGIVAPTHTDGESGHNHHFQRAYPHHLWTAGADWLLQPLLEHAETTGVTDRWLTDALTEVAEFYEDFLTRNASDGTLAIVPSYSPENRPANASWGTINATMDIAASRHALATAAGRSPGHPAAGRWRALADRLPRYHVNEDGALAEWAWPGLRETYDHRHLSHLYPVWPLGVINPYDTPDLADAAHRALELRGAENDSAHGHLHHALIAARLHDGTRALDALNAVLAGDFFHRSLMSSHYPSRDVYNADAAHALPAAVIEMLVQSTPDRLVLLPALPSTFPSGELRGVRTRFGARVDLSWYEDGHATAVLHPTRDARVDVRTGGGLTLTDTATRRCTDTPAEPPTETSAGTPVALLDLTAGVDRVLTLRQR
ncbi:MULTISPECIES: glycosyl hydrolase family 95 catalytic domain-containing protein [unclassified Streptomyces]|uniref:glycosyl hydrolase family 95 catalytic domain-containing protein n=1 Tax=unclassified Streptomyces TaxID=2593676 RepID=UPI0029A605B7|nr:MULTISPECIES: glycoside hydrolase N-terminal domain-containing protein [unclassified Streptomyces]MDX3770736.1 glycoside hydrolase N-terminal domain-containing protein [Streptomyces sp. AK08-01B]MDX3821080.1 glycoside hydrolase N-terminal domain-containing protein [Streptomyces sp. AK08-01A]